MLLITHVIIHTHIYIYIEHMIYIYIRVIFGNFFGYITGHRYPHDGCIVFFNEFRLSKDALNIPRIVTVNLWVFVWISQLYHIL